jgi:type IV pilus assembly protein PilC
MFLMNESVDIKKLRSLKKSMPHQAENDKKGTWDFLNKDIRLFGSGLSDKVKESFYMELSTMLEAGVDIKSALELIKNEERKKRVRNVFSNILNKIIGGYTLSKSLKSENQFSDYELYTIQIGEETGKLTEVLKELSLYYNKKIKQKRQIIGALTYPIIVLVVACGAIIFMISYVVPMFSDIFKRAGDDLPGITRFVIKISNSFQAYSGVIFLVLTGLIVFSYVNRKRNWMREVSASVVLRLPVWGKLIQKIYIGRFAHNMGMLLNSQIPLLQAISLSGQIIQFYPLEKALLEIGDLISEGRPLHSSMGGYKIFSPKLIALIKVGEEVNQLGYFFNKIADQYSNDIEHQTALLSKFIEPFIIILLGIVVGFILIAMYLPLFQLGSQF